MTPDKIIMLGTGNALVTHCFNTCFIIESNGRKLLVDAGGGNGILRQMEDAHIDFADIHDLFLTHAHTDHVMGAVWVVRKVTSLQSTGRYDDVLHIYGHERVLHILHLMCDLMLPKKFSSRIGQSVLLHEVTDGQQFEAAGMHLVCFDIQSTKEKQFGFTATLSDGRRVACLGDEPFSEHCRQYVEDADWLLSEAFCLHTDAERFHPYEKHHSTALDAGRLAQQLGAKRLLLYHTEDKTLETRKKTYTAEAKQEFHGMVVVPDDLEVIQL